MANKERMENINPIGFYLNGGVLLMLEDYYWLVDQAERVEELERKIERYREALTYYAEKSNYDYDVKVDSISYVGDQLEMKFYRLDSEILYDRGEKARKVLEDEK